MKIFAYQDQVNSFAACYWRLPTVHISHVLMHIVHKLTIDYNKLYYMLHERLLDTMHTGFTK